MKHSLTEVPCLPSIEELDILGEDSRVEVVSEIPRDALTDDLEEQGLEELADRGDLGTMRGGWALTPTRTRSCMARVQVSLKLP